CVSVVIGIHDTTTTESQRTQRLHREISEQAMSNAEILEDVDGIAIVGMAGRFPRARNVDEFWRNLRDGVEAISFFTEEELRAAGVDSALLRDPSYVKANGILEDAELFDASFFGINHREAEIMDPQHRIFLEC